MSDTRIRIENMGIENLIEPSEVTRDDSILYLGGRIDDDNLYPHEYRKYLNQKIKELNPKHIICHSHWYAWKYYDKGVLDETTKINTIVCNFDYLSTDTFDPINKQDYQGSHRWCLQFLTEKNPDIVFASYSPMINSQLATGMIKDKGYVMIDRNWFKNCASGFEVDRSKFFTFERRYTPTDLTSPDDLGHGSHSRNSTDGFAILTNLLKVGFRNLHIIGFCAFGSDEDDSYFTEYSTSHDSRVINRKYFDLETSEDQLAEADILKYWSEKNKINNLEDYGELVRYLNGE